MLKCQTSASFLFSSLAKLSGGRATQVQSTSVRKAGGSSNLYVPDPRRSWTGGSIHLSASKRPVGSAHRYDGWGVVPDTRRFRLINGVLDLRPAARLYLDTVMNWGTRSCPDFFSRAEVITHVGTLRVVFKLWRVFLLFFSSSSVRPVTESLHADDWNTECS